jgi:hypothetical protein
MTVVTSDCLHSINIQADQNKDEKQSRSVCDNCGPALDC